jgi:hypothetical protein
MSSSNWKPSPASLTTSLVSNYIGKENTQYRQRGSAEEFVRTISALTPATSGINASTEVAELLMHKNKESETYMNNKIYDGCIKNGWTHEQAQDLIFDRCVSDR